MVAPSDMDDETERLIRQLQQQDAAEYNRSRGLGARERKAPEVYVPPPPGVGTLLKSDKPPESARDEGRREKRARDQRDTRASTPARAAVLRARVTAVVGPRSLLRPPLYQPRHPR